MFFICIICISGLWECSTIIVQTTTSAFLTYKPQKYSFVHCDYLSELFRGGYAVGSTVMVV